MENYKMVVVDDEYLVRTGIRETIEWPNFGIDIVGEAKNGREGLELIKRLKPDVVITDIKMPLMDGVELIGELDALGLDVAIVVLSGFKDFDYAKQALENGAYAYLLKPIDNEELIKTVLIALEKLCDRRAKNNNLELFKREVSTIKNKILADLIEGGGENKLIEIKEKLRFCGLPLISRGFALCITVDGEDEALPAELKSRLTRVRDGLVSALEAKGYIFMADCIGSAVVAVVGGEFEPEGEKAAMQALSALCRSVSAQTGGGTYTAGIGNAFYSEAEISAAYHTAKKLVRSKLFLGLNSVITPSEVGGSFHPNVTEAIEYVAKNYYKPITVKTVAESIYVSESHLMHVFKDNTGKTFNEYLTDYRMMIAKKMLCDGKFKVYEVAEMVGYGDVKYFGQVFKKAEGITPYEFYKRFNK